MTVHDAAAGGLLAISIHTLREEGDGIPEKLAEIAEISIHTLREEGDSGAGKLLNLLTDFYPHPPRGG